MAYPYAVDGGMVVGGIVVLALAAAVLGVVVCAAVWIATGVPVHGPFSRRRWACTSCGVALTEGDAWAVVHPDRSVTDEMCWECAQAESAAGGGLR